MWAEGLCLWPVLAKDCVGKRTVSAEGPCRLRGHVGRVASRVLSAKGLFLWAVLSNIYMVISPV